MRKHTLTQIANEASALAQGAGKTTVQHQLPSFQLALLGGGSQLTHGTEIVSEHSHRYYTRKCRDR